jgi:hypothetical protein
MVSEISQIQKDKQVINSHISTKRTNSISVSFRPATYKYNRGNPLCPRKTVGNPTEPQREAVDFAVAPLAITPYGTERTKGRKGIGRHHKATIRQRAFNSP